MKITKPELVIGSSIRQKPEILKEFLNSLQELDVTGLEIRYFFIDDNTDTASSDMLAKFRSHQTTIRRIQPQTEYICSDVTHHWTHQLMDRLARQKDRILRYARKNKTHVFLVDSDLLLHPWTLQQLWFSGREVIAEIFWTSGIRGKHFCRKSGKKESILYFGPTPEKT